MEKSDLIVQRNLLRLFFFGTQNHRNVPSYWRSLCRCPAFDDLLESRPYSSSELEKIILLARPSRQEPEEERLLYFSHLLMAFRSITTFSTREMGLRLNPALVFQRYPVFHIQDDASAIQSLLLFYQEQKPISYRAGAAIYSVMVDSDPLLRLRRIERLLQRLFAYREFEQGILLYDEKLSLPYLSLPSGGFVLALPQGQGTLLGEDYFSIRFLSSGRSFIFLLDANFPIFSPYNRLLVLRPDAFYFSSSGQEKISLPLSLFGRRP